MLRSFIAAAETQNITRAAARLNVSQPPISRQIRNFAKARHIRIEQAAVARPIAHSRADYPEYHDWLAQLFAPMKTKPRIVEEYDRATSLIAAEKAVCG